MRCIANLAGTDHLRYTGAVELSLQCAATIDSDNIGLEYWNSGCPPNDSRSASLNKRLECYDLVLQSLDFFDKQYEKNPTRQDFEEIRSHAYEVAFSSEDPIFHSKLYDWMVKGGMSDALLEVSHR